MERIFTDVFLTASLCQFLITQGLGSWHLPSRLLTLHFLVPSKHPCPAHPTLLRALLHPTTVLPHAPVPCLRRGDQERAADHGYSV